MGDKVVNFLLQTIDYWFGNLDSKFVASSKNKSPAMGVCNFALKRERQMRQEERKGLNFHFKLKHWGLAIFFMRTRVTPTAWNYVQQCRMLEPTRSHKRAMDVSHWCPRVSHVKKYWQARSFSLPKRLNHELTRGNFILWFWSFMPCLDSFVFHCKCCYV